MQKIRFNGLVCISLLFIMSTVFLVPHSVHAQELEEDANKALVPENEQDEPGKDDDPDGLEATGTDPEPDGLLCTFWMRGDRVHISTGDASGHGWWVNDDCNEASVTMYERLFHRQGPCGRQGSPEVTANMGMFPATIQICHVSLTTRRNGRPPGRCSHVLLASDIVSTHLVGPNRAAVRPEEVGYSCAILVHDEAHSRCVDASSGLTSPRDPHHRFATRATSDPAKPAPDRASITVGAS